jgi:hypothetical protein
VGGIPVPPDFLEAFRWEVMPMRYWGKNIEIDASYYRSSLARARGLTPMENNPDFYEQTVQGLMRDLETKSTVSKLVVHAINRNPHQLRIIPLTLAEVMAPTSRGAWPQWTDPTGAFPKNIAVCGGGQCQAVAGPGSDVVLNYEPYSTQLDVADDPGNNRQPDDALLHELVHCLRIMSGLYDGSDYLPGYHNAEEFFAILITNMYQGQRGRVRSLRADYARPFNALPGRWTDSQSDIYHQYKQQLDRLSSEMPDLCGHFRTMDGFWNPFRVGVDEAEAMKP